MLSKDTPFCLCRLWQYLSVSTTGTRRHAELLCLVVFCVQGLLFGHNVLKLCGLTWWESTGLNLTACWGSRSACTCEEILVLGKMTHTGRVICAVWERGVTSFICDTCYAIAVQQPATDKSHHTCKSVAFAWFHNTQPVLVLVSFLASCWCVYIENDFFFYQLKKSGPHGDPSAEGNFAIES